jgi:acetyl esterase/lipase
VAISVSGGSYALLHGLLEHGAAPRAVVLVSPMVAGRPDLPSHTANEASDYFSRALLTCMQAAAYPPNATTLPDRDWSPAAKVPFFIQYGSPELLASDSELAATKLRAAGARDVTVDVIPHAPHTVALFQDVLPEAATAAVRIREWIKEKVK